MQNSDALGARDRWESKVVANGLKKYESVERPVFDEIIRVYELEIRCFVARKIEPDAVDDVVQEVWVAAWQSYNSLNDRSKVRPWIYGICLHKCHDHYRARHKEGRLVPIADLELHDPNPSPERIAVGISQILSLLACLDESQKEVVELYYYAQLTFAEIATLLDRNMNTVKYQFYRAHATLLEAGKKGELL